MKRQRNRVPCNRNDKWYTRYDEKGFFCLPRAIFFSLVDCIDNATFYAYVALASCHFEGNTTYAASHLAKLTGKDESNIRGHLADMETLGLISREPLGRGFKILFECPTRKRIKEGVAVIAEERRVAAERRKKTAKNPKESKEPIATQSVEDWDMGDHEEYR
ncbi:MAG: hypothetical protein K9K35_15025 [Rhodoferax sp.]|nr:hypothetical protein [Rhodoferax sp.]